MVEMPEIGAAYWIIADFWEEFAPVPVRIKGQTAKSGYFRGVWDLGDGFKERFNRLEPSGLYFTEAEARAAIQENENRRLVE